LIVTLDNQDQTVFLPLVDFHTHIGRVKIETTKGSSQRVNMPKNIIQLYEKLQYEIHKRIIQKPDNYYVKLPPVEEFSKPLYPFVQQILDLKGKKSRGWIVDHIICFPFNDIFYKQTEPKFVKSNQYIRHQLQTMDNCFRFIPFCRVDVMDESVDKEVQSSIAAGARGLKLHPLSQDWIDKIDSPSCKTVLQTAGNSFIPVIFDVPNKGVALDITKISEEARSESPNPINVVLGHTAFDYNSKEVFECISKTGMYAETSGMRGKDVEIFFKNVMEVEKWWEKILFGTDSNYFGVLQAADFITFLLSIKFVELLEANECNVEPLIAAAKILGGNALNIVPKSWKTIDLNPNGENGKKKKKSKRKKLLGDLNGFHLLLKKHLVQKNNNAVIDIIKLPDYDKPIQVLTLGSNSQKKSFSLSIEKKNQKLTFYPFPKDLDQYPELTMNELTNVESFFKFKGRISKKKLTEKTFLESW